MVARAVADRMLARRLGLTGAEDRVRAEFAGIAAAAADGDPACLAVISESARYVSAAILSLTNVMDLDQVVLSGPAFAEAGSIYLRAAQEAVTQLSFMRQVHPVSIELSQLGLRSAAIGAATVALDANLLTHDTRRPSSATVHVATRPAALPVS